MGKKTEPKQNKKLLKKIVERKRQKENIKKCGKTRQEDCHG